MRLKQTFNTSIVMTAAIIFASVNLLALTAGASRPEARHHPPAPFDRGLDAASLPAGSGAFTVLPRPSSLHASPAQSAAAPEKVTYTSFGGKTYTLNRVAGLYTQALLPDAWLDGTLISRPELLRLLDSQDITYAFYKELTGAEPRGEGLLTVAYIPLAAADQYGLGVVGAKGVEIDDGQGTLDKIKDELKTRTTFSGVDHEQAHNFDLYSQYTARPPADGHAWTAALQTALHALTKDPDSGLEADVVMSQATAPLDRYLASGADWSALLTQRPPRTTPNAVWSAALLRIIQLKGTSFLSAYARAARATRAQSPPPRSPADDQKFDDNHFAAIASALGENSECIADFLRWPVSDQQRSALRSAYGTVPATICRDSDGDTYSPLSGDTDDSNSSLNPSAVETVNGRDDDSNAVADDLPVPESRLAPAGDLPDATATAPLAPLNAKVEGAITSPDDTDAFRVRVAPSAPSQPSVRHLSLNVRTTAPDTEVQVEILRPSGETTNLFFYAKDTKLPARYRFTATAGQDFIVRIKRSSAFGFTSPFGYQAGLGEASVYTPQHPTLLVQGRPPAQNADGSRTLTAAWTDDAWRELLSEGVTHVRWWISGQGWAAYQPAAQSASLTWNPPAGPTRDLYSYRVQAVRLENAGDAPVPLTRPSQPAFFTQPDGGAAEQPPMSQEQPPLSSALTQTTAADSEVFVRHHYLDFLGREPDAEGLAFWTAEIERCDSDARCRESKRINVSAAFFLSIEFQNTGYLVERMYKVAYGDPTAGPTGLSVPALRREDFNSDAPLISSGVIVGVGDWRTRLEENKAAYALTFVKRQRFASTYSALSPADLVDTLDANAGHVLSASERTALIAEASSNTDDARASVLRKVAESPELDRRERNRAFVLMEYFGYLRRNPDDAPDGDFRGWKFWLDKLDNYAGDYVRAEMVKAFLDSAEYRSRYAQ